MVLTKKLRFMLFALGYFYLQANKEFGGRFLRIAISKKDFIEVVQKAGIAEKGTRAIYKNLESLEKLRYISYDNRMLKLSSKGEKAFTALNKEMAPYMKMIDILSMKNILKYIKKSQTIFSEE